MFSVVEISKQQVLVKKDDVLYVPRLEAKVGDVVKTNAVYLHTDDGKKVIINDKAKKKEISYEVIEHLKGEKIIAFKMKRRKGFRKKKGHRTEYTKIKIKSIN